MKIMTSKDCSECGHSAHESAVIYCNLCRRVTKLDIREDGKQFIYETVVEVQHSFGYHSNRDGERHAFDVCESCYETKILPLMVIDPSLGNFINPSIEGDEDVCVPAGTYLLVSGQRQTFKYASYMKVADVRYVDIDYPLRPGESLVPRNGMFIIRYP